MSSLIKTRYVNNKEVPTGPRVIDSNEIIAAKLRDLYPKQEEFREFDDGFEEGLEAPEIEEPAIDLEEINRQAEEIIENATKQAESIIKAANSKANDLQVQAQIEGQKKGYEEGFASGMEDAKKEREKIAVMQQELEQSYQEKMEEIEPQLVSVIADIFEKVFLIQFADKKELILNVVKKAVNQIENSKEFLIKVPQENLQFISERKDELQEMVGQYIKIEIIGDNNLSNNQCVIHTDSGVFDCSLDIQLDNLVRDIKTLSIGGNPDLN